jgi:hypothetical protein
MSVWRGIRSDLRAILLTVAGIPDVRWEGKSKIYTAGGAVADIEPAAGVPWIKEKLAKAGAETVTLGAWGQTQEGGIYMLDLYWPANGIMHEGEDLADKIRLAFYHGREVAASGPDQVTGTVTSAEARDMIEGDGWLIFPIRIEFYFRRFTRQAA